MASDSMDPIPPPLPAVYEAPPEPPPYVILPAPVPPPFPEPPSYPDAAPTERALAGLEAGILGTALMLVWFALDSLVEHQYWWAPLNLWGAAIYGNAVFRMNLSEASLAGAALQFFLGGLSGALIGLLIGNIRRYPTALMAALAAGLVWYIVLQFGIFRSLNPVIVRMTPQPATMLAHLLYAAALVRIPRRSLSLALAWRGYDSARPVA